MSGERALEAPVVAMADSPVVPPDAWRIDRAAAFLGISPRTLERYAAAREIPCLVYPPARRGKGTKGTKPILAFDPPELAAWRERHKVGKSVLQSAG